MQNRPQRYVDQNKVVNTMIDESKRLYMQSKLQTSDTKSMFRTVNNLLNNKTKILPAFDSAKTLSDNFALYFREKVEKVHKGLLNEQCMSSSMSSINGCDQEVSCKLSKFALLSEGDVEKLITCLNTKSCMLDPIPTWYLKDNLSTFVHAISTVINMSLSTGEFPMSLKRAVITPIIKKTSLNSAELKNYRPVSSLPFVSKVIEKYVVNTITEHMIDNGLGEPLQSAYRRAHSTETALLKVKSDIMYSIHNQQGVFLVLLDLSCAFDTVDHVILLSRMEKEIGLSDIALQWLKSYFSNRTSRVRIDGELSAEHVMNYGLPQGSTVGPLSFTVYIIPLGRIITKYGLSYHMYADDLQLYISFDPSNPSSIQKTLSTLSA